MHVHTLNNRLKKTKMAEFQLKELTVEEVAKHNTKEDCWIIIDNNVYDVTKYLDSHPGGVDIILGYAGRDDDHGFAATGHSNEAKSKLESLIIGYIPNKDGNAKSGCNIS